jgi:hypothetical protein
MTSMVLMDSSGLNTWVPNTKCERTFRLFSFEETDIMPMKIPHPQLSPHPRPLIFGNSPIQVLDA